MGVASSTEYVTDPVTGQQKEKHRLGGAYPGQRRPVGGSNAASNQAQQYEQQPYAPNPYSSSSYDANTGVVTPQFVSSPAGGNALTLASNNYPGQPGQQQQQQQPPTYIQITVPHGVSPGQTIHVQAPDGRMNAIVIPPGVSPGSSITVAFAPTSQPQQQHNPQHQHQQQQQPFRPAQPAYNNNNNNNNNSNSGANSVDDGFASGFNNPNWRPPLPPPVAAPAPQQQASAVPIVPVTEAVAVPEVYAPNYNHNNQAGNNYQSYDQYPTTVATPVYPVASQPYR